MVMLTQEQMEVIRERFDAFDKDMSGEIDVSTHRSPQFLQAHILLLSCQVWELKAIFEGDLDTARGIATEEN
jgi:hypothetical protein